VFKEKFKNIAAYYFPDLSTYYLRVDCKNFD